MSTPTIESVFVMGAGAIDIIQREGSANVGGFQSYTGWAGVRLYQEYLGEDFVRGDAYPDDKEDPERWRLENISKFIEKAYKTPDGPYHTSGNVAITRALQDLALEVSKSPVYTSQNALIFTPKAKRYVDDAIIDHAQTQAGTKHADKTSQEASLERWEEFSKPENAASSLGKEQQFLIRNAATFALRNANRVGGQQYKNFINVLGEPHEAIATFVSKPAIEPILNIKPHERALIVPKMRLFKVYRPDPNKPTAVTEKEFIFKTFTEASEASGFTADSVTKGEFGRGTGVGITDLNIQFEGTNLFAAKRELKVELKIHFQNFKSLATDAHIANINAGKEITTAEGDPSYLDLVWRTNPKTKKDGEEFYNPQHYEIKLVLGWAVPGKTPRDILSKDLRAAIQNMTTAIYLSQIDHTFSFNQDGSIDLSIDYRGRIDLTLTGPKADLLFDSTLKAQVSSDEAEIEGLRKRLKDDSATMTPEEKGKLETKLAESEKAKKEKVLGSKKEKYINLVNGLLKHDSLYFTDVDFNDLSNITETNDISIHKSPKGANNGTAVNLNQTVTRTITQSDVDDYDARIGGIGKEKTSENPHGGTLWYKSDSYDKSCNSYRLHYFYFGDLLDLITEIVRRNHPADFDDINYILTSFVFQEGSGKKVRVPLASIPISLNYFTNWMLKRVIEPHRGVYFLLDFIREFVNDVLVKPFSSILKRHNVDKKDYAVKFGYKVVTLPPNTLRKQERSPDKKGKDKTTRWAADTPLTVAQLRHLLWNTREATPSSIIGQKADIPLIKKTPQHCVILYPYTYNLESKTGNYEEDLEQGTYHLGLGRNSGIVNEIQFNKSDIKYQSEAAFMRREDSVGQMKRVYNATVDTMGNTLFYPGSIVYLDPTIPGLASPGMSRGGEGKSDKSILAELGLGGYYSVTKVNFQLSAHDFRTILDCIWTGAGDGRGKNVMPEARSYGSKKG